MQVLLPLIYHTQNQKNKQTLIRFIAILPTSQSEIMDSVFGVGVVVQSNITWKCQTAQTEWTAICDMYKIMIVRAQKALKQWFSTREELPEPRRSFRTKSYQILTKRLENDWIDRKKKINTQENVWEKDREILNDYQAKLDRNKMVKWSGHKRIQKKKKKKENTCVWDIKWV